MATYYVDSNATGLDDGSSWTDAWTSIASITAVAAGDTVLVSSAHSETTSVNVIPPSSEVAPVKIISTSTSSNLYLAGASLSGVSFDGSVVVHGLSITSTNTQYFNWVYHGSSFYENCNFTINHKCRFTGRNIKFLNCTWDQSAGSVKHEFWEHSEIIYDSCEILTIAAGETRFIYARNTKTNLVFRCCDIGNITSVIENTSSGYVSVSVIKCNHNITNLFEADWGRSGVSKITDSGTGTISKPALGNLFLTQNAKSSTVSTVYRDNGASDGFSDYSLEIVSNSVFRATSPANTELNKFVESGSQTITVYIAGASSLNDDDFWIEVESPSEEVSPTAQGKFRTTKPDPLATPAALTSDTSSWTGTGVGTKQKIEVVISPTVAGTVTVRCYLAKPSTTAYVDPKISTTGNQRVFNGVLVDDDVVIISSSNSASGTQIYPFRHLVEGDFKNDPDMIPHPLYGN